MTPEMIGGEATVEGDDSADFLDANASTGSISQLHAAFKKATSNQRFFRSVTQWLPCFMKYGVPALATGHLGWHEILGHISVVCRIELDKRSNSSRSTAFAILYDEHRRRDWGSRAERKGQTLDIALEA